jgi:general secretion pathway protein I
MTTSRRSRGFTLVEVMMALAILGFGLTVLIKSAAGNIASAQQAHMMGVVTDLARAKMYDIEETLLKDGFSDTEQHEEDQSFTDEGWPLIHYSYKVEEVELPGFDQLQALAKGHAEKTGSGSAGSAGSGSGSADLAGLEAGSEEGGFQNSALGGMLSQFSGFGGAGGAGEGDIGSAVGASFVQAQYTMFQQILKVSIRKVSLTVTWQVLGSDRDMKVVAFFTDAGAMDKVLSGLGKDDLDDKAGAGGAGGGGGGGPGGGGGGPGGGGGGGTRPGGGPGTTLGGQEQ